MPAGTSNFAVKRPSSPVITLLGLVVTNISLNSIRIWLFALKLEPVTVTSVPEVPVLGDNVITPPAAIVNIAVPILPEASVAVIVLGPVSGVTGILIVAVNVPVEEVVTSAGVVASVVPSNLIVIWLLGLKSEPVTVMDAPRLPVSGDNVILPDSRTLNVADAVFPVVSETSIT
jgi:hypothetical protein